MKRIILLSIFLIISAGIYSVENNVFRHINADIIVTDKKAAADHFVNWAESRGGYYVRYSDSGVVIWIPDFSDEVISSLLSSQGDVINYSFNADSLEKEITDIKTRISVRKKLLSDYYSLFENTDFRSTLSLEREISSVLYEVEQLQGRLNKLSHDIRYTLLEINFYTDELNPGTDISSFDWINSIDFFLLMDEEVPVE